MAPGSFDDVRKSLNHRVDLCFGSGSTEGKSHTFARLIVSEAQTEQHRTRLDAAARARCARRDGDPRKIERHHDVSAERARECGVDRSTDSSAIIAVNASAERA